MGNSRKSRFPDPESLVASIAGRHLSPGDRILLGLSGGLDSVVLFHILHRLAASVGYDFSCIYVHHGISPNASLWAKFCEDLCRSNSVPIKIETVDISPHLASGVEAAARTARYVVFEKADADCIVLAHHLDDQAETVLLQLFRGAGIKGLAAMGEATRLGEKILLRPMLGLPRRSLEDFAREKGMEWITDESNLDLRYDRNYVRHVLFPAVQDRFPAFRETASRTSRHLSEALCLLDDLAQIDARDAIRDGLLEISRLRELSEERARNLLRHHLDRCGARMPSNERLREMLKQLVVERQDACISIRHDGFEIRRYRGFVHVVRPLPSVSGLCRVWRGEMRMRIEELGGILVFEEAEGGIDPEKLRQPVTVRVRAGGEHFRPGVNRPAKSLKNLFQEHGVPPWERTGMPLLFCGEHLVWVPKIGIDPRYRAQTKGFVPRWEAISPQNCDIASKAC